MALYKPLITHQRPIRLLRFVDRPEEDGPIQLQLETFSLNHAPSYDALSYVWGDPAANCRITVNGDSFMVGSSLYYALSQLGRAKEADSHLWIDAICINQNDADEKSSQVRQMRDTFQQADCVWVALGESSDHVDRMLDLMTSVGPKALQAGVLDVWSKSAKGLEKAAEEKHPALLFLLEMLKDDRLRAQTMLDAATDLLTRANWCRAWILQEITLAQRGKILCGRRVLDIDHFYALLSAIYFAKVEDFARQDPAWRNFGGLMNNNHFHVPSLHGRLERLRGGGVAFIDLLINWRAADEDRPWLEASDPRDIVYALMGVASDAASLEIAPDYRKSVSQVYTEATKAMMAHYPQYRLEYCSFPKKHPGLPSWVPDWQRVAQEGMFPFALSYRDRFRASGDLAQPPNGHPSISELRLRGVLVDHVRDVFTVEPNDFQKWPEPGRMMLADALWRKDTRAQCVEQILRFAEPSLHPKMPEKDLWKLMLAGYKGTTRESPEFDALSPLAFRQTPPLVEIISEKQMTYMLRHSYPYPRTLAPDEDAQEFVDRFCQGIVTMASAMARGRTLFVTADGRLGLGPYNIQKDDVATVLFGTKVPIILRPAGDSFTFVGDSVVHGIMQGEAIGGAFEELDFTII